jgi:hypothetical protein
MRTTTKTHTSKYIPVLIFFMKFKLLNVSETKKIVYVMFAYFLYVDLISVLLFV